MGAAVLGRGGGWIALLLGLPRPRPRLSLGRESRRR